MATKSAQVRKLTPLLFVEDLPESVRFYTIQLEFQVVEAWEPDGVLQWCRLELGSSSVMLQQACDEDPPPGMRGQGVVFYFLCDDVDSYYQELIERGTQATAPLVAFYGMKQVELSDPDGYQLCFQTAVG